MALRTRARESCGLGQPADGAGLASRLPLCPSTQEAAQSQRPLTAAWSSTLASAPVRPPRPPRLRAGPPPPAQLPAPTAAGEAGAGERPESGARTLTPRVICSFSPGWLIYFRARGGGGGAARALRGAGRAGAGAGRWEGRGAGPEGGRWGRERGGGVGVLPAGGAWAAPCPATPTAQSRSRPRRPQKPQQQRPQDGERR